MSRPRPRLRILGLSLLAVLVAVVALLPAMLSRVIGPGLFVAALERRLDADVSIEHLDLSWTGKQAVRGLRVERHGALIADLDASIIAGVLDVLSGSASRYDVNLAGRLRLEHAEDGTLSWAGIRRTAAGGTNDADGGPRLLASPVDLHVEGLRIEVDDVTVNDVRGSFAYVPNGKMDMALDGRIGEGTIRVVGEAGGLFGPRGALTFGGAEGQAVVTAEGLAWNDTVVERLRLELDTRDASRVVRVRVESEAGAGRGTGTITGDLQLHEPLGLNGGITFAPHRFTGRLTGERVPIALVSLIARGTSDLPVRDVGPTVDFTLDAAEAGNGDAPQRVSLIMTTEHHRVDASALVDDDGTIRGDRLVGRARITPGLLRAWLGATNEPPIDGPVECTVNLDAFEIPPATAGPAFANTALRGRLTVTGTIGPLSESALVIEDPSMALGSNALIDGVTVRGDAIVDGAAMSFVQTVTSLFDERGAVDLGDLRTRGTATLRRRATLASADGWTGMVTGLLGPTVDAEVEGWLSPGRGCRVVATGPGGRLEADLEFGADAIRTKAGSAIEGSLVARRDVCERYLVAVHPILGDVCSSATPIDVSIADLNIPHGDATGFDATLAMDIGDVELDNGSGLLAPLSIFEGILAAFSAESSTRRCRDTVSGSIEPIIARVEEGRMTYDAFVIRAGEHRLPYAGTIDLRERTIDIRTEALVSALGSGFRVLGVVPTGITVPIETRGSLDAPETTVRLEGLIGTVPESILGGLLNGADDEGK